MPILSVRMPAIGDKKNVVPIVREPTSAEITTLVYQKYSIKASKKSALVFIRDKLKITHIVQSLLANNYTFNSFESEQLINYLNAT